MISAQNTLSTTTLAAAEPGCWGFPPCAGGRGLFECITNMEFLKYKIGQKRKKQVNDFETKKQYSNPHLRADMVVDRSPGIGSTQKKS